jgi:hypothetical protein
VSKQKTLEEFLRYEPPMLSKLQATGRWHAQMKPKVEPVKNCGQDNRKPEGTSVIPRAADRGAITTPKA